MDTAVEKGHNEIATILARKSVCRRGNKRVSKGTGNGTLHHVSSSGRFCVQCELISEGVTATSARNRKGTSSSYKKGGSHQSPTNARWKQTRRRENIPTSLQIVPTLETLKLSSPLRPPAHRATYITSPPAHPEPPANSSHSPTGLQHTEQHAAYP